MSILQHYYTSYTNQETGSTGFQVKAMSPGIFPDLQAIVARLIAYRIPPMLEEHDLSTHPIALRYYYKGQDQCILLCSQSNGKDQNGRPGNFFAHTLVLEPAVFTSVPPIFYWHSLLWQKEDPELRSDVVSLPVLFSLDEKPSLAIEDVWSFLSQGNRHALLYKLLCAVVHSNTTQRRIIILDTTEHVALWIAAVSCLLPPTYRPLLTFATYHHDPYQGQFLITGITSDSSFRATADEYLSYFILNTETGMTSSVDPSPYARIAAEAAYLDLYETKLLPLFTNYALDFPKPRVIDEHLDIIALSAQLQMDQDRNMLSTEEWETVKIVLSSFMQPNTYVENNVTRDVHDHLISALFTRNLGYETIATFWQLYGELFIAGLQQPASARKIADILDFWFTVSSTSFKHCYLVQNFFFLLPSLASVCKDRQFQEGLCEFNAVATYYAWYISVQNLFSGKKSIFAMFSSNVVAQLEKQIMTRHRSKENSFKDVQQYKKRTKDLVAKIARLVENEEVVESHKHLPELYQALSHDQFWSSYWRKFTEVLLSHNVNLILALFSFWFDESFDILGHVPYISQEFFLGLDGALENACRMAGFTESANLIDEKVRSTEERYQWYSLIRSYFLR